MSPRAQIIATQPDPAYVAALEEARFIHRVTLSKFHAVQQGTQHRLVQQAHQHKSELIAGHLSHEQLLNGLLQTGEVILASLPTSSLHMIPVDPAPGSAGPRFKPGGQVLLTNQRMLFISNSLTESDSLAWLPSSGRAHFSRAQLEGRYHLSHHFHDISWFFPVPLHRFRHMVIDAKNTIVTAANVTPRKGCCWFCAFTCPSLCGCCLEDWDSDGGSASSVMCERQLELAVLLPPWDTRFSITVTVAPSVAMGQLQAFAAQYQRCVQAITDAKTMA